jgi:hypothetical protein
MESTTAAHIAVVAAAVTATNRITPVSATVARPCITITRVPIHGPSIVAAAIPIIATVAVSVAATIPGACTDKDAAAEPRRAVVPVGSAGVRSVAIIAIAADRSGIAVAPIHRAANPNANRHLGVGVSRSGEQQDTEYSEIA